MVEGTVVEGRYRLERRVGAGGMGVVWAGHDVRLRRPVAVKFLSAVDDEVSQARFRREAEIAAALSGHPHIVGVHDFGVAEVGGRATPYVVMELLDGTRLSALVRGGPVETGRVLRWGTQVCSALAAAHDAGVVHRDIKPDNLMLVRDHDGREVIKVLDFGIAAYTEAERTHYTAKGAVLGTPAYISPEQAQSQEATARSDLYALGCVLYALLTGAPPFDPADGPWSLLNHHVRTPPEAPSARRPGLAAAVSDLILSLLSKNSADRPADARTTAAALRAFLPGPEHAAPGVRPGDTLTFPPGSEATTVATPPGGPDSAVRLDDERESELRAERERAAVGSATTRNKAPSSRAKTGIVRRATGPWDASEVSRPGEGRVDLGGLFVPWVEGMELRLEAVDDTLTAVLVLLRDSAIQLQAFAAPKEEGIWDEVREELASVITEQGGIIEEVEGPFGRELWAQLPPQRPDNTGGLQPVRFVGVDRPRWFLRGVISGQGAVQPQAAGLMEAIFRDTVVVRGEGPMAPRDPILLKFPDDAQTVPEGVQ